METVDIGRLTVKLGTTRHVQAEALLSFTRVAIKLVGENLVGTPVRLFDAVDLAGVPALFEHLPAGRLRVVLNAFDAADQVVGWAVASVEVGPRGTANVDLTLRSIAGGYEAVYHCPALCGPPPTPTPTPTPTPVPTSTPFREVSLVLRYVDMTSDMVGNLSVGADRNPDGHFVLDLDLPTVTSIQALTLEQYRNGQTKPLVAWSTATGAVKPTEHFLGVLNHGTLIQNAPVVEFGRFGAGHYQWDLYANSGGAAFKHGDTLCATLTLTGYAPHPSNDFPAP